jgi:hypothetical protein
LLQLRTITDVDALGEHVAADAASGAPGRLQAPLIDVAQREVRSPPSAEQRGLAADTAPGTGDQGQLPVHPLHIHRPPTISARAR